MEKQEIISLIRKYRDDSLKESERISKWELPPECAGYSQLLQLCEHHTIMYVLTSILREIEQKELEEE